MEEILKNLEVLLGTTFLDSEHVYRIRLVTLLRNLLLVLQGNLLRNHRFRDDDLIYEIYRDIRTLRTTLRHYGIALTNRYEDRYVSSSESELSD